MTENVDRERELRLNERRSFRIKAEFPEKEPEGDKREVRMSAATSAPLMREMSFGWVEEILDFRGLNTERLETGARLLDSHDTSSSRSVIGVITDFNVERRDEVSVLNVTASFDMSDEDSARAYNKVRAGLIDHVSVGYSGMKPGSVRYEWFDSRADYDSDKDIAGRVTYRDFSINEVSMVGVPADNSVGITRSRSQEIEKAYLKHREQNTKLNTESAEQRSTNKMDQAQTKEPKAEAASAPVEPASENARDFPAKEEIKAERQVEFDGSGIRYLTANRQMLRDKGIAEDFEVKLVEEASGEKGLGEAEVRQRLWDHLTEQSAKAAPVGRGEAPAVHVKDAEHNEFSVARLSRGLVSGKIDGLEAEILQDYDKSRKGIEAPRWGSSRNSAVIPFSVLALDSTFRKETVKYIKDESKRAEVREAEKGLSSGSRAYNVGGTPSGLWTEVFNEDFYVPALTSRATVLPLINVMGAELYQDYAGPVASGEIATYHSTETGTRAESTGWTFGTRKLQWHEIGARKDVSRRSLQQSRNFLPLLMAEMRRVIPIGMDKALIGGEAAIANAPTGIMQMTGTTGINNNATPATPADAGAAPTYAWITKSVSRLEEAHADAENAKWVLTPGLKAKLMNVPRLTGSTGAISDRILSAQIGMGLNIDGKDVVTSTHIPTTFGTGNALHAAILADFSTIDMGVFDGLEITVDDLTQRETGQVRFYIAMSYDFSPRTPASIGVAKDINAA